MTTPAPTLESNLWWTRVKIDLYNKKLLRWVIDPGPSPSSSPSEVIPDRMTDPEGYITWKETYLSVEATLHSCLGGMLPVILADPRHARLGEEGKMLERVGVIRAVYADYDLAGVFDDEDDVDGIATETKIGLCDAGWFQAPKDTPPPTQPTISTKRSLADPYPTPISKRPNLNPSSLPQPSSSIPQQSQTQSQATFDRVYRSPTKISQDTRRLRCKAVMDPDTWGQRCSLCGLPNGDDNEGHRTYACKSETYATATQEPVQVRMFRKPDALIVQHGPHVGRRVCYEWNTRRTRDGRCYVKDCKLDHSCSLCLDDSHRAWDCEARKYLPELPPRPRTMVPADVEQSWRLYSASGGVL